MRTTLYYYPDDLIGTHWAGFSDRALTQPHPAHYTTATGFQEVMAEGTGEDNSTARTRAGEFYDLGFLLGPLVNPQAAGASRAVPLGWRMVQEGRPVRTPLGLYAFDLGRAIRSGALVPGDSQAFGVLCAILLLQLGFDDVRPTPGPGGRYLLTSSLFQFLLRHVPAHDLPPVRHARYVAAGMFGTLGSPARDALLDAYVARAAPARLTFVPREGVAFDLTPAEVRQRAEERMPLTGMSDEKAALYWAGAERAPRGIYSYAAGLAASAPAAALAPTPGRRLLEAAARLEGASLAGGYRNPFEAAVRRSPDEPTPDVLAELGRIFSADEDAAARWQAALAALKEGAALANPLRGA